MTARDLACQSFWTERPLVRLYIQTTGRASFSLRDLIAFAEGLPEATLKTLRGGSSQLPPHVPPADKETIQAAG